MKNKCNRLLSIIALLLSLVLAFTSCNGTDKEEDNSQNESSYSEFDISKIPAYSGSEYTVVNNNKPFFKENEIVTSSYETYGELDYLGRCTVAHACIGRDIMPTEERESISSVYPSGWIQASYDVISGKYLYNRSHLIGFQLTGENATRENLITGTRYMNEAMIPFENMVADYIKETNNHVMYRVTPIFIDSDLVASGVLIEAYSVEDSGEGICFNVYLYNVQPGVSINYKTGSSSLAGSSGEKNENTDSVSPEDATYIINKNNGKVHLTDCSNAAKMSESNKLYTDKDIETLINSGYVKAGCCMGD